MRGVGHDTAVFQPRKGPLRAGNEPLRRIFVVLLREHRVPVFQVARRVRAVQAVSEKLHACGGRGLKGYHDLARDRPLRREGLGSPQAHEPRGLGHIVLPATPGHSVSLAHQKTIARIKGFSGGHILGAVEIA